jgi:hypothetical protein
VKAIGTPVHVKSASMGTYNNYLLSSPIDDDTTPWIRFTQLLDRAYCVTLETLGVEQHSVMQLVYAIVRHI